MTRARLTYFEYDEPIWLSTWEWSGRWGAFWMGIVFYPLLFLLVSYHFMNMAIEIDWLRHALAWAIFVIVYCFVAFKFLSIKVQGNEALILLNWLIPEAKELSIHELGFRRILAQKEFQSGFHWKHPWQTPLPKPIDMTRVIDIESDPKKTYTLADGSTIKIDWQITITPLPGKIVNFTRTREKDIQRLIRVRAEEFLQGYVGRMSSIGFGRKEMRKIRRAFERVYGGPARIDAQESQLGVWTSTPTVFDIGNPSTVEKAQQYKRIIESIRESALETMKKVEAAGGKITYKEAEHSAMVIYIAGENKESLTLVDLGALMAGRQIGQKGNNNQQQGGNTTRRKKK